MKWLNDLHPEWMGVLRPNSKEGIQLDCPACGPKHRLAAYFSNPGDGQPPATWHTTLWERSEELFGLLTLTPSLLYPCWHGWIENGRVFDQSESPLVVFGKLPDGTHGPIALSPMQCLHLSRHILNHSYQMLNT